MEIPGACLPPWGPGCGTMVHLVIFPLHVTVNAFPPVSEFSTAALTSHHTLSAYTTHIYYRAVREVRGPTRVSLG